VDFLADISEALRVASVRNRDGHPDYVIQCTARALEGFFKILEGLPRLRVKVPRKGCSIVIYEPDVACKPNHLASFCDHSRRKGVFCFPGWLNDCLFQRHLSLPSLVPVCKAKSNRCSLPGRVER